MDYSAARTYLDSFTNYEITPVPQAMRAVRLERMERLLKVLGHPERAFRTIHVAGTKGKGSIAAMLASMMGAAGYRVGLYTSPHLETVRERIQIRNQRPEARNQSNIDDQISEEEFAKTLTAMQPVLEERRNDATLGPLTYFEVLTAMACVYFAEQRCDWVVLEAGLGGRLDATNAVSGEAVAFSPMSLDHTEVLGTTVTAIAREKAGFLKQPGQLAVSSPQAPEVSNELWAAAQRCGAWYEEQGRSFVVQHGRGTPDGTTFDFVSEEWPAYRGLTTGLLGAHQAENAATAIALLARLRPRGVTVTERAIRDGLAAVRWPGRCEIVQRDPLVIVDGAQNAASARSLRCALEQLWPGRPVTLVLGISANKDLEGIMAALVPGAQRVMLTQAHHARAATIAQLAAVAQRYTDDWTAQPTVADALQEALAHAGRQDVIVMTGSLFLVGETRRFLLEETAHAHGYD